MTAPPLIVGGIPSKSDRIKWFNLAVRVVLGSTFSPQRFYSYK